MSRQTITISIRTEISTEDKYCGCDASQLELCAHLGKAFSDKPHCHLFGKALRTCLGGGPLRCDDCLEAERKKK